MSICFFQPIFEATQSGELKPGDWVMLKVVKGLAILVVIENPTLTDRVLLWFFGYHLLLTGSECRRLYLESASQEEFCDALYSL